MTLLLRSAVIGALLATTVPGAAVAASRPPSATASGTTATIAGAGKALQLRTGPATDHKPAGTLADGARVAVACQVFGQQVSSPLRRTGYWDRLTNGKYISDAYVRWLPARPAVAWCGTRAEPITGVVAGGSVNVRRGPGTAHTRVGALGNGTRVRVICQSWGQRISGPGGASNAWNHLGGGRYVADARVTWRPTRPALPWCGQQPATVPAGTTAGFIARVAGSARLGYRQFHVPASVTIAQAILESGWGRSGLTRRDHNYFGVKCFGSPGRYAVGCRSYATSECGGGRCWRTSAQFRAYRNPTGSLVDHGYFLTVNPRYHKAFAYHKKPDQFAKEIHKAGYATSPTYATNVINLMRKYNLYRFDR